MLTTVKNISHCAVKFKCVAGNELCIKLIATVGHCVSTDYNNLKPEDMFFFFKFKKCRDNTIILKYDSFIVKGYES